MSIRGCLVALVVVVAVAIGCESRTSLPASPSTVGQGTTLSVADSGGATQLAAVTEHGKTITLFDACDPETFFPVPCARNGGIRFDDFLEQLRNHQSVNSWHMAPGQATIKVGDVLSAFNRGGESHTFTEVDEFGGGRIGLFNDILHLTMRPECAEALAPAIPPGGSFHETEDEEGDELYQCCFHPWMRTVIHIVEH